MKDRYEKCISFKGDEEFDGYELQFFDDPINVKANICLNPKFIS
jgi:hypothetical protein